MTVQLPQLVVRGLEYYTGPVFEAELTFPATDESGQAVRFGSVGGGGRYDGLVSRFRSQPVPATGFSIGVSRLYAALSHLGKIPQAAIGIAPVVVLVMDKGAGWRLSENDARLCARQASARRCMSATPA